MLVNRSRDIRHAAAAFRPYWTCQLQLGNARCCTIHQPQLFLIAASQGGTYIQPWAPAFLSKQCSMPACESGSCIDARPFANNFSSAAFDPQQPGVLYNNMVYPFRYMNILSEFVHARAPSRTRRVMAILQASFGTKPRATSSAKHGNSTHACRSNPQPPSSFFASACTLICPACGRQALYPLPAMHFCNILRRPACWPSGGKCPGGLPPACCSCNCPPGTTAGNTKTLPSPPCVTSRLQLPRKIQPTLP